MQVQIDRSKKILVNFSTEMCKFGTIASTNVQMLNIQIPV